MHKKCSSPYMIAIFSQHNTSVMYVGVNFDDKEAVETYL